MKILHLHRILAIGIAASCSFFALGQTYTLVDLGSNSPYDETTPTGINDSGVITGWGFTNSTGATSTFIWNSGTITDLGALGYPYGSSGSSINNGGEIAAIGYGPGYNAITYLNGVVTPVGNIDGGYTAPYALNNLGDIVGRGINGDGGGQGFSYIGGVFTALGVDIASGINDSDSICGSVSYYYHAGDGLIGVEHGFIDIGGTITQLGDLGGGPTKATQAISINNLNEVTGYSTNATGAQHAFFYSNGTMVDLGTEGSYDSYGVSINDSGTIIGTIQNVNGAPYGAVISSFVYQNGSLNDLLNLCDGSSTGWSTMQVTHINNHGYIVGLGVHNGVSNGFLAIPYYPTAPDSFSVFRGHLQSGNLQSLGSIDGNSLVVSQGPTLSSKEAPVSVVVTFHSSVLAPTRLALSETSRLNIPGAINQRIEAWNIQTQKWDLVSSSKASVAMGTVNVVLQNPQDYVNPTSGEIQCRLSWMPYGPILGSFWECEIDQVQAQPSP